MQRISLKFDCLDIYNLAIHNNSIPLIDEIRIFNESDINLKNIELEITSSQSFFNDYVKKIGNLSSGRYIIINPHDLEIDLTKVMYSVVPINTVVYVKLKSMGEVICESSKPVTLLPYNYIPSVNTYTELVSSLVTPEQEEVKALVPVVLDFLKKDYNTPINQDMWNYSDRTVTDSIIKSIYNAICSIKISFNTTPISENVPNKVRLAESVLKNKSGTALEIALLTASLSEKLGINTFLVFAQDKILLGFFYRKETFETCVCDDARPFAQLKDGSCERFSVIDTTSMIYGTSVSFDSSSISAQKIIDSCDAPIIVDIARCRKDGYKPIPSRIKQNESIIFEVVTERVEESYSDDSNVTKSFDSFLNIVKNKITNNTVNNSLISIDKNTAQFLIGSSKFILSKIMFNGKVNLKNFPLSNSLDDDTFFTKLIQLNKNIDDTDLSGSVTTFHDKEALKSITEHISEKSKGENRACVAFGVIKYKFNEENVFAPIFLLPVSYGVDNTGFPYLKFNANDSVINPCLNDLLEKLFIPFDSKKYSNDVAESYDELIADLSEAISDTHNVDVYDISCVSVFKISDNALSSLASPEYLSKSDFITRAFSTDNKEKEKSDSLNFSALDIPFSLDNAQAQAVSLAESNDCTIINGPNGSGKTLSCASLAFSAIRRGERVLYLSNSSANIKKFIELAEKSSFASDIMTILDSEKSINSFEALNTLSFTKDVSDELITLKNDLNKIICDRDAYFESLHKVKEIGFSLYEAVSQYERYRSFPYSVTFTNSEIEKLTRDSVVAWFDAVSSLAKSGSDCKEPHSNPLFFVKAKEFSYDVKSKAAVALSRHLSITQKFINSQNALSEFLGIEIPIMRENQTDVLFKLSDFAQNKSELLHYGFFLRKDLHNDLSSIENLILHCDDIFDLKDFLNSNFTEDIINLDCDSLLGEWRGANSKFAFAKSSALSLVKNKLKAYAKSPKIITNENFVELLSKISRYKNSISLIEENAKTVYEITGIDLKSKLEQNECQIFSEIKLKIDTAAEFMLLIDEIYEFEKKPATIYAHCSNIFKNPDKVKNDISPLFNEFSFCLKDYKASEEELTQLLELDISCAKEQNNKLWYYFVIQFFERMLENIDLLKYWCKWNVEKEKCISIGLSNVVKLYEAEQITSGDIKNAFLKGFFKSVSEYFLSCDSNVNNFSSDRQLNENAFISSKLRSYRKLIKEDLNFRVNDNITNYLKNVAKLSSDEAEVLLKNKFGFGNYHNSDSDNLSLLQKVKPCFVCESPMFLSKFKSLPQFDLILVDSNYFDVPYNLFLLMPLTKRFVYTESKNTRFGQILKNMGASSCELNWFYNSNYTYVLANELFYNNSMSLTPLMSRPRYGINVIEQLGNYEKKKTRVNIIEASAVVDEIIKYLSDSTENTVGVYTMTEEQKKLIEVLLQKRVGDVAQKFLVDKSLFIRSFESASYESRDVIIFSTVFSEEQHSKYKESITKTIPELSKPWSIDCLINVLTSAKKEFTLITSLSDESLDNFKTTEVNYCTFKKTLRRFFDTSETRNQEINANNTVENSIIRQVADFIESLGYRADLSVGCNHSRVDIAVKNKGNDNYLLGIIFDETAYVNSKDFFGRNLILHNLDRIGNWKILRIHTIDWFENQSNQLDLISSVLNDDKFETQISINS